MLTPNSKTASRIQEGLKRFHPIVESAKNRDVNESDTVVMLTGMFSEIFGFDKYTEITTELAIRGTYCDLALKIDGKYCFLVEAKAVGIELKDLHIKQAVDYAANKGIEWVILTNAVSWKIFKVIFSKPIEHILVVDFNFLNLSHKSESDIETLFIISKEACCKSLLDEYYTQKEATDKFIIGNLLLSDPILSAIRKEIKTVYPDIKVSAEEISDVLKSQILRREILEGDGADGAIRKISRAFKKKEKERAVKESAPQESTEQPQQ